MVEKEKNILNKSDSSAENTENMKKTDSVSHAELSANAEIKERAEGVSERAEQVGCANAQSKKSEPIVRAGTDKPSPARDETPGLSAGEVNARIKDGLTNAVSKKISKSYLSIFVGNIFSVFNLLGLIVFIALLSVHAQLFDFSFAVVYAINITIGILQEIRAKRCIDKLSLVAAKTVTVMRDGEEREIAVSDVVLGDVIKLSAGRQIPADCTVIEGIVEANESLLTGESVPVRKKAGDELLSGSFIVAGRCFARAEKVGKESYSEKLSEKAKKYKKPHSELMSSLTVFIRTIGIIIVPIAAAYIIKATVFGGKTVADAIHYTSTVVLGMIPSGMFMLTSLALAVGIIKLAKQNTLVQDLYSLEMLARVDVICFDKTGTITDGKMTFVEEITVTDDENGAELVISSMLAELKDANQTAIALCDRYGDRGTLNAISSLPFNSTRKLSAVTFEGNVTYAFGAPEFVLTENEYGKLKKQIELHTSNGLRVLVLARSETPLDGENVPDDFTAISLLLIADNVRSDAAKTISWFKENGVAIKVISGDNPVTVSEVAKRVGIVGAEKYISLEGLSDEEVEKAANEYVVFGRVSPEQKAVIVKALKNNGHTTAMTGDGVNDIIALKEADCAISVASGSEAARSVAHLVLMDDNFSHMPQVVHEGRRVINNVQSSASLYLMKTFFTIILALTVFWIRSIPGYPFTPKQMTPLEMVVIGIASLALSMQPNDARIEGRFISNVVAKSLPAALLMVISVGAVGIISFFDRTTDYKVYTTMATLALTFAGFVNLLHICRPFNKFRAALCSVICVMLVAILAVTVVHGMKFIGLTKLSPANGHLIHLIELLAIIVIDFPLSVLLNKLAKHVSDKLKKIKEARKQKGKAS